MGKWYIQQRKLKRYRNFAQEKTPVEVPQHAVTLSTENSDPRPAVLFRLRTGSSEPHVLSYWKGKSVIKAAAPSASLPYFLDWMCSLHSESLFQYK